MAPSFFLRRRRKRRADITKFKALIAAPAAVSFVMRAPARVGFITTTAKSAGTAAGTIVGSPFKQNGVVKTQHDIKCKAFGASGGRVVIDMVEKGATITPAAGFDVQIDIGLGKWRTVCT